MAKSDETTVKLPSPRILATLVRLTNETKDMVGTAAGVLGQSIKDAAERHNLHPAAFKLAARLKRMDPVKLNAFLTHFDDYRDKLKLDDMKAADLPGLDEDDKKGEEEKGSGRGLRSIPGGAAASAG